MPVNVSGGDLQWDAGIDLSQFNSDLQQIRNGLASLTDNQKKQGADLEDFAKKAAQAAAGYFSIQAAKDFVVSMVQVRGEFQQIEVAYRTMLGSKEKADKLMAESVKLAAVTPFTLQDVASGSKQLLAYGFAAEDITKNLETLGNIASGVGSQLNDVVYLYGTLKASGRVTQMDINQFAGRGIPVYQALADTMKITTAQVREYVSAGKIGFPEIEKAFNSLTGAGGQFYNLMQEQSKTLTGQLSNLEDAWSRMLNDLGQQNEGIFASAIGGAIELINNYQNVINILASMVAGYGAYRAALILTAATTSVLTYATAGFTAAEILQYYWTTTLTKAQKLLNLTMLSNPYVAVAAALAALGTYLYLASENTLKLKTAAELTADAVSKQGDAVDTSESKLRVYVEMLRNTNLSESERLNIYNKIKSIDPSIVKGIDAKTLSYANLKTSVDAYIASLRQKFAAEANESAIKSSLQQEAELRKNIEEREKITNAYLSSGQTRKDINKNSPGIQIDILKQENDARTLLLKQQIETNKLIGKSIQTGSKEQIAAAENDLKIIESQKKLYAKGSIELLTVQQQALDKQNEIDELRKLKKKAEAPKSAPTVTRTITVIDKEIDSFKEEQKTVATKKEYESIQAKINKLEKERIAITGQSAKAVSSAMKAEFNWSEKRLEILNKISEAESKVSAKSLSQNEREIAENKAYYKSMRDELDKYNREAKSKGKPVLGAGVFARVDNLESKENYEIEYKQKTAITLSELEKQKSAYEAFEQYKVDFGEKKAKEKFENEINLNKTYQQIIEEQLGKLLVKDPTKMTGAEKSALEAVKKLNDEAIKAENEKNDALLKEFQTYAEKRQRFQENSLTEAARLRKLGRDDKAQEAINDGIEEVKALDASQIKKMSSYKNLFEFVGKRTRKQILEAISLYEIDLKAFKGSAEEKAKAQKEVDDLKKSIKNDSSKDLEEVVKQLERVGSEFSSINGNIGNIATVLLNAARSYIEIQKNLKTVNDPKASTADKIGAGLGIAGAAISVATSVFGYFKGLKEAKEAAHKAMDDYQAAAIKGELDYQALLRKREQDDVKRGKNSYKAIVDQLELLKKQSPEVQKAYDKIFASLQGSSYTSGVGYQHGTWLRKAKTWDIMASLAGSQYADLEKLYTQGKLQDQAKADFESLKALKEELKSAGIDVQDLQSQLNELLTGTSVSGLADSLTSLFENGKFAAADFGNSFEEIMKNAITNSFKYKLLEDGLQPFYDEFSALFTNGTPTKDQIDTLKAQYLAVGKEFGDKFKELEKITGISLTDKTNATAVTGTISAAGLTENTANIAMGIWRGQYDLTKSLVKLSGDSLAQTIAISKGVVDCYNMSVNIFTTALEIRDNTFRTANNTDNLDKKLDRLIANTSSGSSYQNLINGGVKP